MLGEAGFVLAAWPGSGSDGGGIVTASVAENPPQSPFSKGGGRILRPTLATNWTDRAITAGGENPPQSPFSKGGGRILTAAPTPTGAARGLSDWQRGSPPAQEAVATPQPPADQPATILWPSPFEKGGAGGGFFPGAGSRRRLRPPVTATRGGGRIRAAVES